MTDVERRNRARWGITFTIALTHVLVMILAIVNRLAYTVPPTYEFLAIAATNPLWILLHGATAIYILIACRKQDEMFNAMAVSAGVIGCWALINLLWGLAPVSPVSLAGPVFATGMSFISYFAAHSWIKVGQHEGRR